MIQQSHCWAVQSLSCVPLFKPLKFSHCHWPLWSILHGLTPWKQPSWRSSPLGPLPTTNRLTSFSACFIDYTLPFVIFSSIGQGTPKATNMHLISVWLLILSFSMWLILSSYMMVFSRVLGDTFQSPASTSEGTSTTSASFTRGSHLWLPPLHPTLSFCLLPYPLELVCFSIPIAICELRASSCGLWMTPWTF